MRRLGLFLAPLLLVASAALGQIINPPPFYNAPGGAPQLDNYTQAPRSEIGYAAPRYVPVCNASWASAGGLNTAGAQTYTSRLLYCPRGAKSIRIMFSGVWASGTAETDLTAPIPINIGIWANAPAPWNPATTYVSGNQVVWNTKWWQSNTTNTNSTPQDSNTTNWTAFTPASTNYTTVTQNGQRSMSVPTVTTAGGSIVTTAYGMTDPISVNIPAGGFVLVKMWTNQSGTQQLVVGIPANISHGELFRQNTPTVTDNSLSTPSAASAMAGAWSLGYTPFAVIGIPQTDGPTACIIGDSIGSGSAGGGFASSGTLTNGGTGYIANDVGVVVPIPNTNAGAYGASPSGASYLITGVTGGAVSSAALYYGGSYNQASRNAGGASTPPSGAQTMIGATGTGWIQTPNVIGQGYDSQDTYGGSGYVARGLNLAGIPYVQITEPADSALGWTTRDYSRLALIAASGCSSVINQLGINGMSSGAATVEAQQVIIANQLRGLPSVKAVFLTTLPPNVLSTDGYTTTGNQTPQNEAARVTYNTDVRAGSISGYTGYFEIANTVETAQNSGFWQTSVTACLVTCDGLHMTPAGDALAAVGISSNASILK